MSHVLEREQLVRRPKDEVFAFFADPSNLERITPPSLRFAIVTPGPIPMRAGTVIDYRLRLLGVPFAWRTLIESYEPGRSFVDVQVRRPYRLWRHLHEIEERPAGTLVKDRVEYALPLGPLGRIAHGLFVRRQLDRIFDFRSVAIAEIFGQ